MIGQSGTTVEARVNHNQFGIVMLHSFCNPAETDRVRFCSITAHNYHYIRVLDVDPMVGHGTAPKCWSKTCYRWGVSVTCNGIDGD